MIEQGTDRYGAEYKRTDNDFHARYLEQDNCVCSICHGTGAKIEIRYVVRNYESARAKKKICKNLQAHERSLWICPKCIDNFKQKLSVINERNLTQPKHLPSAEPKKGRWIFTRYYVWECSVCGKNPTKGMGYVQRKSELFRYCPCCGSKMEMTK